MQIFHESILGLKADVKAVTFLFYQLKSSHIRMSHSFKDKPASECHLDMAVMAKYPFSRSRRNATFWSKVGEMGVGETGVGKQVPIRSLIPSAFNLLAPILSMHYRRDGFLGTY